MATAPRQLQRRLRLRDLILYGLVIIQPTAPMPIYGVVSQTSHGQVSATIVLGMIAMLFTAISYGRMARLYPSAGSAYTYVSREIHPNLGFLAGWSITLDYLLNPLICTIWCSKAMGNFLPLVPYPVWVLLFVALFTLLNLRGIEASAKISLWMAVTLTAVVAVFLAAAFLYAKHHVPSAAGWLAPLYRPQAFSMGLISRGTAIAVLTYIGFDAVSTLSEEAENPRRDIMRAIVLTCLLTGLLALLQVYSAALVWPDWHRYPDVDTAFVWIGRRVGGAPLFVLMNSAILLATVGSGFASQLAAARLLYGMGREGVLPARFFAALSESAVPRNNVLLIAVVAAAGALVFSYGMGAELLNFGAFIAFFGVNAAAAVHALRQAERKWLSAVPPLLGGLICLYIWFHLSRTAMIVGAAWLAIGLLYGIARGILRGTSLKAASIAQQGNTQEGTIQA